MTKNELINDMNFRTKCCEFGLDWMNFEIYDGVIILPAPKDGIYVLLSEDYNVIGIHTLSGYSEHDLTNEEIAKKYQEIYNSGTEILINNFCSPFESFSLRQILEIASKIEVHETNHGHSCEFSLDGYIPNLKLSDYNQGIIAFIKFLGELIKQYNLDAYHMQMLGFEYPDVYTYIRTIIYNIKTCIFSSQDGTRILPIDIIKYLGLDRKYIDKYNHLLYAIIELLTKASEENTDLSALAQNLLKEIELSNDFQTIYRQRQK